MKKFFYLFLIILFFGIGCGEKTEKEISRESIGKIIDVQYISPTFNQGARLQIKTEQMFLILYDSVPVKVGVVAYIVHSSNGYDYITWEGTPQKYLLYKR